MGRILQSVSGPFARWDRLNRLKEDYRNQTAFGFGGGKLPLSRRVLADALKVMERAVLDGIEQAAALGGGVCPTYFTFESDGVTETPEGPMPTGLTPHPLPLFLEGPTRWLKLDVPREEKNALAEKIQHSGLYDRLCRDFHAAVPFLDPARYGRSPLENVSFPASSANPDPSVWGRGFVARLSGPTAEFLQIWLLMFFGPNPFRMGEGGLELHFSPCVPDYLMGGDGTVQAVFLGRVPVTYHASGLSALLPGKTKPARWTLTKAGGETVTVDGPYLSDQEARMVRDGGVQAIEILMK